VQHGYQSSNTNSMHKNDVKDACLQDHASIQQRVLISYLTQATPLTANFVVIGEFYQIKSLQSTKPVKQVNRQSNCCFLQGPTLLSSSQPMWLHQKPS
jgi:hypothetical protein